MIKIATIALFLLVAPITSVEVVVNQTEQVASQQPTIEAASVVKVKVTEKEMEQRFEKDCSCLGKTTQEEETVIDKALAEVGDDMAKVDKLFVQILEGKFPVESKTTVKVNVDAKANQKTETVMIGESSG